MTSNKLCARQVITAILCAGMVAVGASIYHLANVFLLHTEPPSMLIQHLWPIVIGVVIGTAIAMLILWHWRRRG